MSDYVSSIKISIDKFLPVWKDLLMKQPTLLFTSSAETENAKNCEKLQWVGSSADVQIHVLSNYALALTIANQSLTVTELPFCSQNFYWERDVSPLLSFISRSWQGINAWYCYWFQELSIIKKTRKASAWWFLLLKIQYNILRFVEGKVIRQEHFGWSAWLLVNRLPVIELGKDFSRSSKSFLFWRS